ncbi:FkbM family methyltransferase [Desulfovibrio sp. OttesenSCG-928-C06]|nr:FkbM family methyltransferase [Desulfovibrio sp. OttesenSCG-928-C06]
MSNKEGRTAFILGNGPSLKHVGLSSLPGVTFGMNAAYRYWDRIGWYPTYYSCLDEIMGIQHQEAIWRLIDQAATNGICKFLLRQNLIDVLGVAGQDSIVFSWDRLSQSKENLFFSPHVCGTGSQTCAWAAHLGYRDIVLLGVDGHYVDQVDGAVETGPDTMKMVKTPEVNPNYFFDDYQQVGDTYHKPNLPSSQNRTAQHVSWSSMRPLVQRAGVIIVNANPDSFTDAFPKTCFEGCLDLLADIRQARHDSASDNGLCCTCSQEQNIYVDENRILLELLPPQGSLLIAGAYDGRACLPFLRKGWNVYALEADADNLKALRSATQAYADKITIDDRALSCIDGGIYPWHQVIGDGLQSGMFPYSCKHAKNGLVTTVTAEKICTEHGLANINCVILDINGFELPALWAFPFDFVSPDYFLISFNDAITAPLGYTLGHNMSDTADFMQKHGYNVYVSEWYTAADAIKVWRKLAAYPMWPISDNPQGVLIASKNNIADKLASAFEAYSRLLAGLIDGTS